MADDHSPQDPAFAAAPNKSEPASSIDEAKSELFRDECTDPPTETKGRGSDAGAPSNTRQGPSLVQGRKVSNNFILRNWRGEFPLWITYWGFGFLGTVAIWLVVTLVMDVLSETTVYHPLGAFTQLLWVWALASVFTVWQLVGTWRSADRSITERRQSGNSAPWAWAAKVMVVLGTIRFLGYLVTAAAPQLTESGRIAFLNDPDIPDYVFRLMNEDTEIEIIGGIKHGLDRDFRRILEGAPKVRVVHLDSVGGRMGEAEKLYRTIRDLGLATFVSNDCLSACGNVFAGGRERWISRRGRLGYHRAAFLGDNLDESDEGPAFNESQFLESGIAPEFIRLANRVPNKDMWYPQTDELLRYNVVTGITDDWQFALSGIGGDYTREEFERILQKRYPLLVPFAALEPNEYGRLVDDFHQGYLSGRSAGALVRVYEERVFPKVMRYVELADDETLRQYLSIIVDQYRYFAANREAKVCAEMLSGNDSNARKKMPAELVVREVKVLEQVLYTVAGRSLVLDETLQPDWEMVAERAHERLGKEDYDLIWEPVAPAGREEAFCKATIVYYEEIQKLPIERAAALVRSMVRQ